MGSGYYSVQQGAVDENVILREILVTGREAMRYQYGFLVYI